MKNKIQIISEHSKEFITAFVLVVLLVIILNPLGLWMPDMVHMIVFAALLVVFAIFASFVLKEKTGDEREGLHQMYAGRVSFFLGSAALIIGIISQSLHGSVDIWLIITLVLMILGKIGARIYSDWHN